MAKTFMDDNEVVDMLKLATGKDIQFDNSTKKFFYEDKVHVEYRSFFGMKWHKEMKR